jgi:hypothetical protein
MPRLMSNSTEASPRSPRELNRVILRNLMPLLVAAYAMCFLDRTNIGIAKDRLQIDLGLSATAYGIGPACSSSPTRCPRSRRT